MSHKNEQSTPQQHNTDSLNSIATYMNRNVNYRQSDSIFSLLEDSNFISTKELVLIHEYVCNKLYDSLLGYSHFTYNEAIYLSHQVSSNVEKLKQYQHIISFPFQLGTTLTIPQVIKFGSRKDVDIIDRYTDVYSPDCTTAGNRKTFLYKRYDGNDLEDLKDKYNNHRNNYYHSTNSFLYKHHNSQPFNFTKNRIVYNTHIESFGKDVMKWSLSYKKDYISLYIDKYGEPLFATMDSNKMCWDFKNIRLLLWRTYEPYTNVPTTSAYFTQKDIYKMWQKQSPIIALQEEKDKKEYIRRITQKAFQDSIEKQKQQFNDL